MAVYLEKLESKTAECSEEQYGGSNDPFILFFARQRIAFLVAASLSDSVTKAFLAENLLICLGEGKT